MAVPYSTDAVKDKNLGGGSAQRYQTRKSRRQRTWSARGISIPEQERSGTTIKKPPPPKVNKGVVQADVEEDSKINDGDEETVLPSYAHLLKSNRFVNISIHADAKRE